MSFSPAGVLTAIERPEMGALQRTTELIRRGLHASAAFLWSCDGDGPALLCSNGESDALDAAVAVRDVILATGAPARHDFGSHAALGIAVRLGDRRGALCVAAAAPRQFSEDDLAALASVGALIETLEDRPRLPLQALVELSGTLLREAQEASPAMPADALLAAADSLDGVATRLRELSAPAKTAAASVPRGATRILLADDLDLNRRLIADMLSLDGHHVDCVNDGAAAVRAMAAERYDLVLMDMVMPEMDGLAATRAIRALPRPARDVPIVALTANAMREQLDSCLEAGMDAALTKPMSLDALTAAVAHWTRGRHAA